MYLNPHNQNLIVRSIRKGWGSESSFWEVSEKKYKCIEMHNKPIRWGGDEVYKQQVYLVYDHEDNLVVEIESCSQLTITYFRLKEEKPSPDAEVVG